MEEVAFCHRLKKGGGVAEMVPWLESALTVFLSVSEQGVPGRRSGLYCRISLNNVKPSGRIEMKMLEVD